MDAITYLLLRNTDDSREDCFRRVLPGHTGLASSRAIVNDNCRFHGRHCATISAPDRGREKMKSKRIVESPREWDLFANAQINGNGSKHNNRNNVVHKTQVVKSNKHTHAYTQLLLR